MIDLQKFESLLEKYLEGKSLDTLLGVANVMEVGYSDLKELLRHRLLRKVSEEQATAMLSKYRSGLLEVDPQLFQEVSISSDGPRVEFQFLSELTWEHAEVPLLIDIVKRNNLGSTPRSVTSGYYMGLTETAKLKFIEVLLTAWPEQRPQFISSLADWHLIAPLLTMLSGQEKDLAVESFLRSVDRDKVVKKDTYYIDILLGLGYSKYGVNPFLDVVLVQKGYVTEIKDLPSAQKLVRHGLEYIPEKLTSGAHYLVLALYMQKLIRSPDKMLAELPQGFKFLLSDLDSLPQKDLDRLSKAFMQKYVRDSRASEQVRLKWEKSQATKAISGEESEVVIPKQLTLSGGFLVFLFYCEWEEAPEFEKASVKFRDEYDAVAGYYVTHEYTRRGYNDSDSSEVRLTLIHPSGKAAYELDFTTRCDHHHISESETLLATKNVPKGYKHLTIIPKQEV